MYQTAAALSRLAMKQHGLITAAQVHELGYTPRQVEVRLDRGDWQRVHRGLYLLAGHRLTPSARVLGACLTLSDAVASHESAAWLHDFPHLRGAQAITAVCVGPGQSSRSPLARVHRYDGLGPEDVTIIDGIPVTSAPLTLFHLSAVVPAELVARILDDRLNARAVHIEDLLALGDYWTRRGRPRRKVMRRLLSARCSGYVPPASALEFEFLKLLRTNGLPEPRRQCALPWARCAPGRVDFYYPSRRVVVEVDGRRWHGRDKDFNADRARDRAAQLEGLTVLRYTWHEVTRRPQSVVAELRRALAIELAA